MPRKTVYKKAENFHGYVNEDDNNLIVAQGDFEREPIGGRELQALGTFEKGVEICKKKLKGIKFWLSCGTALGLCRDGTFIPHDLDIDIAVEADWNKDTLPIEEKIMKAFRGWTLIRTMHYQGRVLQIAYMSPYQVIFDFTFYYTGLEEGKYVSLSDVGVVVETKEYIGDTFVPIQVDKYFEERYGPNWQTPTTEQMPWNHECHTLKAKKIKPYLESIGKL